MREVCEGETDCAWLDGPCARGTCEEGACVALADLAGTSCEDGYECTVGACDEAGACVALPVHDLCGAGEICQPLCFGGVSGCGRPPTGLSLSCGAGSEAATCSIVLEGGATGQVGCMRCSVNAGFHLLSLSDFEDEAGACSLDGWTLASGARCSASVGTCDPTPGAVACCSELDSICTGRSWGGSLQTVFEENCGGGFEQWRLSRTFDTRGLAGMTLCFDAGEAYAVDADAIIAAISDDEGRSETVGCLRGSVFWRGGEQTLCTALPEWASDNPALTVTLVAHVDGPSPTYPDDTRRMSLSDVLLYGADAVGGATERSEVFADDFEWCEGSLRSGEGGWTVTGSPSCSTAACDGLGAGVVADDEEWALARVVDTSALSGDVRVCLQVGHEGASNEDLRFVVSADVGDGRGWVRAGSGSPYQAAARQCEAICFGLSGLGPRVAHNPGLGIMVAVESPNAGWRGFVDEIAVSGVRSSAADDQVSLGAITETGSGAYEVTVTSSSPVRRHVEVVCSWIGSEATVVGAGFATVDPS